MRTARLAPLLPLLLSLPAAALSARFPRAPEVRGDTVVFSWEGDLFRVPLAGGTAVRMTTHPGHEDFPKLSPDGRLVAFQATYDGVREVYLMPVEGGLPRRLTYTGDAQPVAWTPDGKRVVFRSGFESTFRPVPRLYWVTTQGELPQRLPVERGILCSFSPDGKRMLYNRRGNEEYYWKRYKGGQYTDVWLYDFGKNEFSLLTDYVGKNAYPMWVEGGALFVSDRGEKGIANLYRLDPATRGVSPVTAFDDFDVQMPSSDGRTVVFVQAGWLQRMDVATGKVARIEADVASDRWALRERDIQPKDWIQSMAVGNGGKWAAFEARGDVFLVPADEARQTRNLTPGSRSRERFPRISPDGRKVAFLSDRTGEYQLYLAAASGEGEWEQLTTKFAKTLYHPEWSPDGTRIVFADKDLTVWTVEVATRKLTKVASSRRLKNDEFTWEISDYAFSPDGRWLAYTLIEENRNGRIWLHDTATGKSVPVTDGFYDSLNPSFDARGDLLYFLSYRSFAGRVDVFEDDHVVPRPVVPMAVQLRAGQRPPFEKAPKDEKPAPPAAGKGEEGAAKKTSPPVVVDLEGLSSRAFPLPVKPGNYFHLKAGKGLVTWGATDDFGEAELDQLLTPQGKDHWTLTVFDVDSQKETVLEGAVADWRLSPDGEQAIVKKASAWHVAPVEKLASGKALGEKLNLDRMKVTVRPAEEWAQVFDDAWRWYRDFFYDPAMHGRDWEAIGKAYRAMVPALSSRAELNWLLSQMVGELCVSHTYVTGGDTAPRKAPEATTHTGFLGADLVADPAGRYRFAAVLRPSGLTGDVTAPLARPDVDVKEGDFLIAVDGHPLVPPENPYGRLQVVKGQKVRLTVSSTADGKAARSYDVEPVASESALRYDRWVAGNVRKVDEASGGEIGYLHLTAMGVDNVAQFDRYWRAFRYRKGLVIDVRGNGGGWTEYFMIDKLERQMVAYNVLKEMEPFRYPIGASSAHLVVLSNEYNGSDGEAFVEHFKARKLGTVIGVPSWGGLVGIVNGQPTVDGGTVQQSNNAFYGRDGKWLVENHGADPDVLLDNDPASASAGRDLQLDKAIEVLKRQIAEKPFSFPPRPPYPVR